MKGVTATVVIPTHAHPDLLPFSLASAQAQTVVDIEIFVIGDGVMDASREIVMPATASDPRVRFFDNPKGPRHGEVHRHAALADATGSIVCYLSDDDLWFPNHIETMLGLLSAADVAHALPLQVTPDGDVSVWAGDMGLAYFRKQVLEAGNFVPLACFAHTLAAYRRLPAGWRTSPDAIPTDQHMYRQFLAESWCRAIGGWQPTVMHFPSPDRTTWTASQRVEELGRFAGMLGDSGGAAVVTAAALRDVVSDRARWVVAHAEAMASTRAEIDRLRPLEAQLDAANLRATDAEVRLAVTQRQLDVVTASRTWRTRNVVAGIPLIGAAVRWLGRRAMPRAAR